MKTRQIRLSGETAVVLAIVFATAFMIGCGSQEPERNSETQESPPAEVIETPVSDDAPPPAVTLRVVNAQQYAALVGEHHGKVVLVDFWATWCTHCVEQFPHTVQLHKELGDKGLVVISVSMNDPEEEEETLAKLQQFGATFENLLGREDGDADPMETFGVDAGLPFYKIYDRKGQLRYNLADTDPDKPLSTDDIDSRVNELLAEQ
jgi:thiol-disulfide isomerase/thioredoxin